MASPIILLPTDVLKLIFGLISGVDRVNIARVCVAWNKHVIATTLALFPVNINSSNYTRDLYRIV